VITQEVVQDFVHPLPSNDRSVAAQAKLAARLAAAFVSANSTVVLVSDQIYTNAAAASFSDFALVVTRPAMVQIKEVHVPAG